MNNITLLCTLRVIEPDSLCRVISMYYSEKTKLMIDSSKLNQKCSNYSEILTRVTIKI